jgi:dTDP-4-dehydrorhamnose 3,5-epimerase
MDFEKTWLADVIVITPERHEDARGYFTEVFRQDKFREHVGEFDFVQDNQSQSVHIGTIRGLHFQRPPKAQGKLVRCIAGVILDVAVDIRRGSPTYGEHVAIELTAENDKQLWIPPGFAHGFCALTSNAVINYKVTEYYSAEHDSGLLWNDDDLAIDWKINPDAAILSEKDQRQPSFAELVNAFTY